MPPEVAVPAEHFAAGGTVVRLDVRVREKVGLQVAPLVETPGAHGTLVRRLLHVEDLVHREGPALAESFAALRAFERLLLAVDVPGTRNEEDRYTRSGDSKLASSLSMTDAFGRRGWNGQ